jgi:SAM-dependent methyltransferase
MPSYTLDNASPHGADHLNGLSGTYDDFTRERIAETTRLSGARCLELGAGNGSIALWLADQVGPTGEVTAVDLDVSHVGSHDQLRLLRMDLLNEPLPDGPYDLVHGRLVFAHLPNREAMLADLRTRLAPGGTILIEDFDPRGFIRAEELLATPAAPANLGELWGRYARLRTELFASAGTDHKFIDRVHGLLLDAGLVDVQTVSHSRSWRGGEPGSWHASATLQQFRPRLVDRGFPDSAVDALVQSLDDPQFHSPGRLLRSTSGRAPA